MIKKSVLSNRVRVLTETIPGHRSLSMGVLAGVGSLDDPVESPGLAHFTEHALFQGTSSRDAAEISRLIDQAGGHMSAFTGRDYTCFYANIMEEYAPFAIDLLGDVILNSTFPEECLAREREAIVNEINLGNDDPFSHLNDLLRERMWPNQPHGRPVSGDIESVSRFTREDVVYFSGQNYTPDRLIIAAAGAVQHEIFLEQVQDAFWRLLGSSAPQTACTPHYCPSIVVKEAGVSQAYFSLVIPTLRYDAPQRYDLHLLNTILGGGISSRLYNSLREEQSLVYFVQSSYHAYRDLGMLWIEGVTRPENLQQTIESIRNTLHDLASTPVDEEEIWKAQLQMRGQHQLAADSNHTRMSRLMTQEFYFGQHLVEDEVLAGIENANAATVQAVARQLCDSQPSCAVLGPLDASATEEQITALVRQSSELVLS